MNPTENTPPVQVPAQMQMIQLLSGFQIAQALYVVAKLDVATILEDGPRTVDQLAAETNANADALGRIIRFLAALDVFRTHGDKVENTALSATLAEDDPNSLRYAAFYLVGMQYGPFSDLLHTALTGETAATRYYGQPFFDWISTDAEKVEIQNRTFANVTNSLRAGMFDGYQLPKGAVVADLGGADGSMLIQLLADDQDRWGIVFDRPEVVAAARKNLATHGLADRVQSIGGDFFQSVPPADVYVLSYVLHDWDDEFCRRILHNVAKTAAPGARVVLIEAVSPPDDIPHLAKVLDLQMLAMVGGRERTAEEYQSLLESSGFTLDRIVPSSTPFSFIEATLR
ncbi:methyltransferase [Streptomyces sp. NPDC004074]|uniref:methyltransferase n=1 Tax=Streptomyces sp. NPDC004074 TaxID=3154277 RepID=UPI0033AFFA12